MNLSTPYFPPYIPDWQEEVWLGLTIVILLAWWAYFAARFSTELSLAERILAAFTATIAQIQATIFLFGFLHRIGWWELGVTNFLILLILGTRIIFIKGGRDIFQEIGLLFLTTVRLLRSSFAFLVISVIAVLVAGWFIYIGQLLPPYGHDPWGYHYTWTALAHQERHLGPFLYEHPYVNHYPMNAEMLFLWSFVGCGTERWANITGGIFALSGTLACYLLARAIGARRTDAASCGLLLLSVPAVVQMMWMGYVDLATMGGFLASIAFLARRRLSTVSCVVAGCAAGFTLGTKGSGVFLLGILLLLLLYRMFPLGWDGLRHFKGPRLKRVLSCFLVFLVLSLLFGSYFYIRNAILTGNPTGIFTVEVADITFFEGEEDISERIANVRLLGDELYDPLKEGKHWPIVLDGLFDPETYYTHANRIGGWGIVWTALLLPAIPIAFIWALLRKKWSVIALILCCIVPFFLFRYNPYAVRFHYQVLAAGTTAFAYILALLGRTHYRRPILAIAVIFMAFMAFMGTVPRESMLKPEHIELARAKPYLSTDRFMFFDDFGDSDFTQALWSVQGGGTTLALSAKLPHNRHFASWNQHLTNRVVWVEWEDSGQEWESALRQAHADSVYVLPDSPPFHWANRHSDTFSPVYSNPDLGAFFNFLNEDDSE